MIPGPDALAAARRRLHGLILATPLLPWTRGVLPCRQLFLKLENLQRTRSFKPRGAFNASLAAAERGTVTGLITFSSGNHGQAVALAARHLGVPAMIVAPEDVRPAKLLGMESLGATVMRHGLTSAERMSRAMALAQETGHLLVPPYDHPDVIAGQSTVGQEIAEQAPEATLVVSPVGGGGLISGIALALAGGARVAGVEPADADDAARSLRAGSLLRNERPSTSACDGLRNTCVGDLPWSVIRERVATIVAVTEDEVSRALHALAEAGIAPVEPSGAASLAAVLAGKVGEPDDVAVAIISGGNAS